MLTRDADPLLGRIERRAAAICVAGAAATLAFDPSPPGLAASVLSGGLLAAISYASLKRGVDVALRAARSGGDVRPFGSHAARLARLTARYALLLFVAYVMMARLRLHPIGLIAGASSVVLALAVEAVWWRGPSRPASGR